MILRAETFCMKLISLHTIFMRSSSILFPASGALGRISSAGTLLSSLAQQYQVTSSVTARFAAVIPSASGQSIVNTRPDMLYISP